MSSRKSSQSRITGDIEVASGVSNSSRLTSVVHESYVYKREDRLESRGIQVRHVGCRDVPREAMIHQTTFTVLSPSASHIQHILSSEDYPLGLVAHRKPFKKSTEHKYPSLVTLIFNEEEIKRLEEIFWNSKKGIPYQFSFENELREFLKAQAYSRKKKGTAYSFADAIPFQPKPRTTLDDIRFPRRHSIKQRASRFWMDPRGSMEPEKGSAKARRKTKKDAFEVFVDTSFFDAKMLDSSVLDAKIVGAKLLDVPAGEKEEEIIHRPSVSWSGRSVPEFKVSRRKDSRKPKQRKKSIPESQLTGVKGHLTDVKGQLSDVKGQLSDVKGQLSDVKGQLSDVKGKKQKDSSHTLIASSKVSLIDVKDRTIQISQLSLKGSEFEASISVKKGKRSRNKSIQLEEDSVTSSTTRGSRTTVDDDQSQIEDTDIKMREFLDDEDIESDQHRPSHEETAPEFVQSGAKVQRKSVKKKAKKHVKKSIRPAKETSSISIKQKESELVISGSSSGKESTKQSTPHEPEEIPDESLDDSTLDDEAIRAGYDRETWKKLRRYADGEKRSGARGGKSQGEDVGPEEHTSDRVTKKLQRMLKAAQRVDSMQAVTAEANLDLIKKQEKQEVSKCYVGRWDDEAKSNVFQDLIQKIEKREAPLNRELEEGVARLTKPRDMKRYLEEFRRESGPDKIIKPDTSQTQDSSKRTSTEDGYGETHPVDKDREEKRKHVSREHADDRRPPKRLTDVSDTSVASTHLGSAGRDGGMGVQLKDEQLRAAELISSEKGKSLDKLDGVWALDEDVQKDATKRAMGLDVDFSVWNPEIHVELDQGVFIQELRTDEYDVKTRSLLMPGRTLREDTLWSRDKYGETVSGEGTPLRRSLVDDGVPTPRRYDELDDTTRRLSDVSRRSRIPSTISEHESTATDGSASTYHTEDGRDETGSLAPSEDPNVTLGKLVAKLMGRLDKEKSSTRKLKHAAKMDFQIKMQELEKSHKRRKSVTHEALQQKDMVRDSRGRLKKEPSSVEVSHQKGKEKKESWHKSSRRIKTRSDSEHVADEREHLKKTEWEETGVEERKRMRKKTFDNMDDEEWRQVKSGRKRKDTKSKHSSKLAVGDKEAEPGEEDQQLEALKRVSLDVDEMLASEGTYSPQSSASRASMLPGEDAQTGLSNEQKQMMAYRLRERTRASELVKAMPREILGKRSLSMNPLEPTETITGVQSHSSITSRFGSLVTRSSSLSYSDDNLSTASSSIDQGSVQGRFRRKGSTHSMVANIGEIVHAIGKSDPSLAVQSTDGKTGYRPQGYSEEFHRRLAEGVGRRASVTEEEYLGRKRESLGEAEFYEFGQKKKPSSATELYDFGQKRETLRETDVYDFDGKKQPLSDTDDDLVRLKATPSEIERKKIIKKARKISTFNKIKIAEMKKEKLPDIPPAPRIPLPSPFTGWDFERPVEPRDFTEFPEIMEAIPQLIRLSISREERLTLPEIGLHHQHYIHKTAPHTEGDSYLLKYGIVELLEYLMFNLIMRKPDQPVNFLVDLTRTIMTQMKARYEMAQLLESASASASEGADKASLSLESSIDDSQSSYSTRKSLHLKT